MGRKRQLDANNAHLITSKSVWKESMSESASPTSTTISRAACSACGKARNAGRLSSRRARLDSSGLPLGEGTLTRIYDSL